MKLLIDMNLSPKWVSVVENAGWDAVHWSIIGRPDASDKEILRYAKSNGYIIFTHDLDIGNILAVTKANCPSVIQVRVQDVTPQHLGNIVISALRQFDRHLKEGALVTINEKKSRARILPIKS
jgi:predicted nuclease of predicted toxin-antitoxin system